MESLPANTNDKILKTIVGQPPNIQDKIEGCRFSPRCNLHDVTLCNKVPSLENRGSAHFVACHKV